MGRPSGEGMPQACLSGYMWALEKCVWDFMPYDKLGEVFPAAAGAFLSVRKDVPGNVEHAEPGNLQHFVFVHVSCSFSHLTMQPWKSKINCYFELTS